MLSIRTAGHVAAIVFVLAGLEACSSGGSGGTEAAAPSASSAPATAAAFGDTKTDTVKQDPQSSQNPPSGNPSTPPVSGTNPSPTTPVVTNPAPNPLRARQVRILCLGDSMTSGSENTPGSFRSYRGRLQQLLSNANINADFIGTSHMAPAIGGDPDHEGYGGAFIGPGGSVNNLWDRLPVALGSSVDPDIVIMAFGWNSVYNEPTLAADKYQAIVNQVALLKPSAHLILATLSPQKGDTQGQSNLTVPGFQALNDRARSLASASTSDKLYLADFSAVTFPESGYWDIIHWLQPNADIAAQIIFDSLIAGPLKP